MRISDWSSDVCSSDLINVTIATLPDGAVVTYTVTVQTPPDFTDDLVNAVTVSTPTEDPDPTCPDCETPPLTPDPQADIVTVKTVSTAGQTTFVPEIGRASCGERVCQYV